MKIAIISVTENGRSLSEKISRFLGKRHSTERFCFEKHSDGSSREFSDIRAAAAELFGSADALVFVCSCGIAVRAVAPCVKSKISDPAVIAVDDRGKFAVPILSGHLGGANRLAEVIAEEIGAVPVITTATDVGGRFSPDSFARANDLIIEDLNAAKQIAAAVLDGEKIGLKSDLPCKNPPPEISLEGACRTGLCISANVLSKPFEVTLNLIPRNVVIGVGCRRGISCAEIERRVFSALSDANIDARRVFAAATIDIKSDEKGLLEFCGKHNFLLKFFSAKELMSVEGDFEKSDFVLEKTGADNVCERSAVRFGGKLIMRRSAGCGVTAAAAEVPLEPDFERKIL